MIDEMYVDHTSQSVDEVKRVRRIGWVLVIFLWPLQFTSSSAAADVPCADRLTEFANSHEVKLDLTQMTIGPRWVAAGHEVRKLPGHTVRIPMAACSGVVAVDLAPDCQILKSRGEDGCRAMFPLTFH